MSIIYQPLSINPIYRPSSIHRPLSVKVGAGVTHIHQAMMSCQRVMAWNAFPWNIGTATDCHTEREFFIDNLLVRIHFIIVMIRWTGLAPWEHRRRHRLPHREVNSVFNCHPSGDTTP